MHLKIDIGAWMLEAIIGEGFKLEKLERLGRGSNQCGNTLLLVSTNPNPIGNSKEELKKENTFDGD